ncbi:MAG: cell division protein FtsZ, partial [Alphaproteobacteria bacterium]
MCALNLGVPDQKAIFKPRILVLGVGGAGGNAVNNMIQADLQGVEFAVTNTDAQALEMSLSDRRVRLGTMATQGLGAGANPMVGRAAAEESLQDVLDEIGDVNMVFITAGMGGGTGTGAAPLIAKALKERGVLTVGVATKPFAFEGVVRMRQAEEGIDLFASTVDTLIVIPNENLFRIANENTSYADALKMADEVLYDGVRAISDLIVRPGNINLDFADVRALMTVMGKSMMGTGEADGENRALDAAERAIKNPLLDDVNLKSAKGVLLNISGGPDLTMYEVDEAAKRITREVMPESNIITGTSIDPSLDGTVRVSVVATGIDEELGQQEATPTNGFARQELGLAPSAAAPVKPTPIAPPAPATNVASKGRGGAFTIGSGTGGVIHTIQGVPGSMEFARAVANPPKPAAEPTPAPQAVEAAD